MKDTRGTADSKRGYSRREVCKLEREREHPCFNVAIGTSSAAGFPPTQNQAAATGRSPRVAPQPHLARWPGAKQKSRAQKGGGGPSKLTAE